MVKELIEEFSWLTWCQNILNGWVQLFELARCCRFVATTWDALVTKARSHFIKERKNKWMNGISVMFYQTDMHCINWIWWICYTWIDMKFFVIHYKDTNQHHRNKYWRIKYCSRRPVQTWKNIETIFMNIYYSNVSYFVDILYTAETDANKKFIFTRVYTWNV